MAYAERTHTISKILSYIDTIATLFLILGTPHQFHVSGYTPQLTTVGINLDY